MFNIFFYSHDKKGGTEKFIKQFDSTKTSFEYIRGFLE